MKIKNNILLVVYVLVCVLLDSAWADDTLRWKNLEQPAFNSPLAGLSQIEGAIVSIAEDHQGFMWFVARNGLWRWDSQTLTPARFTDSTVNSIKPEAQVIYADNQGKLWLGTKRGLYQFDPSTETFIAVELEQLSFLSIENIIVTEENQKHSIFLAGDRHLFRFNPENKALDQIELPEQTRIHAIQVDNQNRLWVGTGKGLYFAESVDAQPVTLQLESNVGKIRISALHITEQSELWVGTATHGYFIRDANGNIKQKLVGAGDNQPWLYSLAEVQPGVVWLGTFGDGIIEIDTSSGVQRQFNNNRLQPAALADDNIWAIYRDSRELVWVATANGVNVFDSTQTAIKHVYGGLNTGQGLHYRTVHTVNVFDQQLLVGTGPAGIEVVDPFAGSIDSLWHASTSSVETLYTAPDGSVYGSGNFTSVKVHTADPEVTKLSIKGRNNNAFTTAFAKKGDVLWLGGTDGLWQYNERAKDTAIEVFSDDVIERRVASLLIYDQQLWVGLWRGIGTVDLSPTDDQPTLKLIDHPILNDQFIASMHVDDSDQIWVATSGVGIFIRSHGGSWQQITVDNGLPGNVVSALSSDNQGRVWASTTKGIAVIDTDSLRVTAVVSGAMAVNSPFTRAAVTHTPFNEIIFGGSNGLTIIDANQVNTEFDALPLVLTKEEVITENGDVRASVTTAERLVVAPLPQRVSFEFVALDFINPEQLHYRYRLSGLEKSWTVVDANHRSASYTSLAPGDYVLEVAYSNDGELWSEQHLSRKVIVIPAWYQVRWVQLSGIIILCLLILLGHRLGLAQYRKQKRILELKVAERTADLVAANKQLSMQAQALENASLTDALTGLRNRRFLSQHIEDDIAMLQRHYVDCNQAKTEADEDSDMLFFLVDLDHFKKVNDKWGHQAGDSVLIEMRNRLEKVFRTVDYLIRWGGEEFLIVARHTSRSEASVLAERIATAVGDTPFEIQKNQMKRVTCSIGFAAYPLSTRHFDVLSWQETIALADEALYKAKANNRDTWMGFSHIRPDVEKVTIEQLKTKPQQIFEYAELSQREKKHNLT